MPKKKKRKAKAKAKTAPALLAIDSADDVMIFGVTWSPADDAPSAKEAALAMLSDNDIPVAFSHKEGISDDAIVIRYRAPASFRHVIRFELNFQGRRSELAATASQNGAGKVVKPVTKGLATSVWSGSVRVTE
jgi:hypothetical protein